MRPARKTLAPRGRRFEPRRLLQLADVEEHDDGRPARAGQGNKERRVPLTAAAESLAAWLAIRGDWPGALFCPIDKAGHLQQRSMTDQAIYYILRRLGARAGVKPFTPHDMNRSCGGDPFDAGADLVAVQRLLGHAKPETTAGYDRRGDRAVRKAASLLHVPYVRPESRDDG